MCPQKVRHFLGAFFFADASGVAHDAPALFGSVPSLCKWRTKSKIVKKRLNKFGRIKKTFYLNSTKAKFTCLSETTNPLYRITVFTFCQLRIHLPFISNAIGSFFDYQQCRAAMSAKTRHHGAVFLYRICLTPEITAVSWDLSYFLYVWSYLLYPPFLKA